MAKTPLILLTASLLLALTFTVSCSENGEDGDPSSSSVNDVNGESSSSIIANGGGNNSSSSISGSSSSSAATDAGNNSSSSSANDESSSSKTASGDNNFEGISFTKSYALRNVTDDSFEFVKEYEYYRCREGGNLVKENGEDIWRVNYSISNNVLVWKDRWSDDSLHFAGTLDNLIGSWARTKDKNTSCKLKTYDENTYPSCKEGWEIVKAEFATSIVEITENVCVTDEVDGTDEGGWKYTATDCNSFEISKGTEKVTAKITLSNNKLVSLTETYKDKTCIFELTSTEEKVCKKAWDEYHLTDEDWSEYYDIFFWDEYDECIEQNGFPVSTYGNHRGDDDAYGAVLAKPLPKSFSCYKTFPNRRCLVL